MKKIVFSKLKCGFSIPLMGLILLLILFNPAQIKAQEDGDIIQDILKTADILNETILDVTALSDEEENAVGKELDKQISNDLRFTKERKFNLKKIFNNLII